MIIPRWYQSESVDKSVEFFKSKKQFHALNILPTGSGKSVVIANIAKELNSPTLIFQPSIEILQQNFKKYMSYGFNAGIYSASAGMKRIMPVTFATIGSVVKKPYLFKDFKNFIIDECHLVNAKGGMYHDFIHAIEKVKVLGLTATPYRLTQTMEGPMLKFLTRTNPRIFNKVLYYVQNSVLFNEGHLARLEYYPLRVVDRSQLQTNNSGTEFTDQSLRAYYRKINMPAICAKYSNQILAKRKNLLVFCSLLDEARAVQKQVEGSVIVDGEMSAHIREQILKDFQRGKIKCVINVGVLTTGFDYPELEAVLIARSTMSLALYYQIIGRVMRPHPNKLSGWVVDLGGNYDIFGKIETMEIKLQGSNKYAIWNNGRQLTNVSFKAS